MPSKEDTSPPSTRCTSAAYSSWAMPVSSHACRTPVRDTRLHFLPHPDTLTRGVREVRPSLTSRVGADGAEIMQPPPGRERPNGRRSSRFVEDTVMFAVTNQTYQHFDID